MPLTVEFTGFYHDVGADTKAIVPIAEGIEGLIYGEVEAGKASIYIPCAVPLAFAPLSVAQTNEITSPALTAKVTWE